MNYRWLIGSCFVVALVATPIVWALCVAIETPSAPPLRVFFISGGTSDNWERTVEGARAAAKDLGIDLQVRKPTADDCPDQQAAVVRAINFAECDGVAICPVDPESQLDLVSDIAEQTKLVTIGNYYYQSAALCHVGFSPSGAASIVARLIFDEVPLPGKIVLLSSHQVKRNRNSIVDMQVNDFKEQWT